MTAATTTPPILNLADIEARPRPDEFAPDDAATRDRFAARMARLGPRLGLSQLGCSLVVVPPGKRAFPFHNHHVNDELFVVLEGSGELRLGAATHAVRAGDVIGCPPGGPASAHQLVNTGDAELRYLAISTMRWPEVCDYPDSGKFAVYESGRGADGFYHCGRAEQLLDYWDGE